MDTDNIKVYNFNQSLLSIPLRDRSVGMAGMSDGIPTSETFTLAELEYIHAHSAAIRLGLLEFDEGIREEVYAALHIPNWRATCLFECDIDDLLSDSSLENCQRIIDFKDSLNIERLRAHCVLHKAMGDMDISVRIADLIGKRHRELISGIVNSKLRIVKSDSKPVAPKGVDIQALVAAEIEKRMAQQTKQTAPSEVATPKATRSATTPAKKKPAAKKGAASGATTTASKKAGRPAKVAKAEVVDGDGV